MNAGRFVLAMAWLESRAQGRRLSLLTAAVSVGVGALVAINSFTDNLSRSVEQQSRALLGADVTVSSRAPFSAKAEILLDSLACGECGGNLSRVTSFSGMAYVPRTSGTRLVQVEAVEGGYPFYGEIKTSPAGVWARLQTDRWALVDPSFLTTLNAAVGDTMALGEGRFVIAGTVLNVPGDVGVRAAFGPRVYIPARYLRETSLLGFGSRASYEAFIKLPQGIDAQTVAKQFRPALNAERTSLRTVAEDERDLKSFLEQLGRYLGLVALIALLLGGIGVGSAVQVFIRQKRETIAVLRCLGASAGRIFSVYLVQAGMMGLAGSAAGVALGVLLQLALPAVFGDFLPVDVSVVPSPRAVATGLGVGLWVSTAFALLPLLGVRQVAPLAVLRRPYEERGARLPDRWRWMAMLMLGASVVALAGLQVADARQGAFFAGGVGAALLVLWLAAVALIKGLRRWFPRGLPYVWRQGLANLYRPANQTVAVVLALGFGAFLLGTVAIVQSNLLRDLSLDAGAGRPNLVLFDIQPDQREGLAAMLRESGLPVQPPVPIVPMRILSVKGRMVAEILADSALRDEEGQPLGKWAFRREYRSTYRDTSVASEKVVVGEWWAGQRGGWAAGRTDRDVVPISMEVSVAGELGVTIRDTIVWDIQGIPLATRIVNLREVNWARFEPNFFVVFPTGPLDQAPQSLVLLTRVDDPAERGRVQRRVVERFPNVTSIDLSLLQGAIERIVSSVTLAIRFMALLSLATGTVVFIGAVATSRFQRIREAVLLRTLGASRGQVIRVLAAEYLSLGFLAAIVATVLATAAGWALMKYVFESSFSVPWLGLGGLGVALAALTVLVGLGNSAEVLRKAPLEVLRSEE